jgi:hypothetical protein
LFVILLKYEEKGCIKKKEVCAYKDQFPVAFLHNIANPFSLLWGKSISRCYIALSEKNKWNSLASADIKKMKETGGSISNMDTAGKC